MYNRNLISEDKVNGLCRISDEALTLVKDEKLTAYRANNINRAIKTSAILNHFFEEENFRNRKCIEVGPGRYEFSQMARYLGAEMTCVERSITIVSLGRHLGFSLGRHLGFNVIKSEFFSYFENKDNLAFDGLFIKNVQDPLANSLNNAPTMAKNLSHIIKPNGWGWCVLRNRFEEEELMDINSYGSRYILQQKESFLDEGWEAIEIDESARKNYGLKVKAAKWIFFKNLEYVR